METCSKCHEAIECVNEAFTLVGEIAFQCTDGNEHDPE